jgi:Ca2+-binding EF-hand superfamily protein
MVELGPEDTIEYWFNRFHSRDVKPDAAFEEIKEFAFKEFAALDQDDDGFLSKTELTTALDSGEFNLKQKGFINFLLKRIGVIEETYIEQWADWRKGISLVDVQEYFARDN